MPSMCLYIIMYMISFILVLSSNDWFLIWMGLEINMMMFIVMMYRRYSMCNIESCLKYFFIQSLASSLLFVIFYFKQFFFDYFIVMSLSMKLGAGPFFFWFPSVCSGIEWMSCFFMMSFQKILPLMLMTMFNGMIIWMILLMSLFFGILGSFNQTNVKQLLAYSSIHHLGWIFLCNLIGDELWILYLLIYSIIIFSIIYVLLEMELIDMKMIDSMKNKWWLSLMILGMGGMPPMLGFFLKVMVFNYVIHMNVYMILFMIIVSIVMFYVYFRMIFDVFMLWMNSSCWWNFYYYKKSFYMIDLMGLLGVFFGIFSIFIFFL